jgi:hypothetical protein
MVKALKRYGFMRHVTVYNKVVILATGGAIVPAMPYFVLNNKTEIKFLWITYDPKLESPDEFLLRLGALFKERGIVAEIINTTVLKDKGLSEQYYINKIVSFCEEHSPQAAFFITNPKFAHEIAMALDKKYQFLYAYI